MAQKMRAAMTHKFGRDYQLGTQAWQEHPVTGKYVGNPSLSVVLSQYMVSLRRRNVRVSMFDQGVSQCLTKFNW